MEKKSSSKEEILNRMYSHAAVFWGVENVESLDPGIRYLIQSLASELFRLSNEMENIRERILRNLSSALTPDNFTLPRCSHAVMTVRPTDPPVFIGPATSFFLDRLPAEAVGKGIRKLDFSPVGAVRLIGGDIRYLVCERMVFSTDGAGNKSQLAYTGVLTEKYNNTVWIALDLPRETDSLENIPFYIDFPQSANRETWYTLLPYTKWEAGGRPLKVKPGLPVWEGESAGHESLFLRYDPLKAAERHILDYYRKRFLTITGDVPVSAIAKSRFPVELEDLYEREVYESFEPCLWLKVKFPPNIPAGDLHNINVQLNAFPVANRTLHGDMHRHNGLTDIIPLHTEAGESFLAVAEVTDSGGDKYRYIPYRTAGESLAGSFNVRRGGVERPDARGTRDMLEYLTDLLRTDASMFSAMGVEYLRNTIDEMGKGLAAMGSRIDNLPDLRERNYLLVSAPENDDNLYYTYWTTLCEAANGLGAGKTLSPYDTALAAKGSCVLVGATTGGKSAPDGASLMEAFKYSLTTHDKINSFEDICNLCRFELNGKISDVRAQRGVMVSPKPKEGLLRCTDVLIMPLPGHGEIVEGMREELKLILERRSPDTFNYRVIVLREQYGNGNQ